MSSKTDPASEANTTGKSSTFVPLTFPGWQDFLRRESGGVNEVSRASTRFMELYSRRTVIPHRLAFLALLGSALLAWMHGSIPALAFDFRDVAQRAKELAAAAYRKPTSNLPNELRNLTYDQYRDIRFKPEEGYWKKADLRFELEFFHEGFRFDLPVKIYEVTAQGVREIPFDSDAFNYGKNKLNPDKLRKLGFAGFRVHYPINKPGYKDEVLAFLGASYFRAVGKGQRYGLSARGLAIDTALPSGEEFPRFTEFWVVRPSPSARELTIYALLDSPSATGAYRFVLVPGVTTALDTKVQLYLRKEVGKLGLAPLTSMFFFGANQAAPREDYRPQVHDSDGLSLQFNTSEWIWRPLVNPKRLLVTSFTLTDPLSFGLMQRARKFCDYEDLEARYDLHPSGWVAPKGPWGGGRVELVEIPEPNETEDNIVAFWVPDHPPPPQRPYDFEYRVLWEMDRTTRPPQSWVAQTRRGLGYEGYVHPDNSIQFVIDFEGPALRKLPPLTQVDAAVWIDPNGKLLEKNVFYDEVTRGQRMVVRFNRVDDSKPVEIHASVRKGSETLSETWSYILPPD